MDIVALSFEAIVFLFFIAVIAGLIDTLAGGGGLITIPALMVAGVPPLFALGTNKLQGCTGTATATILMFKKKRILWDNVKWLMLAACIGSVIGTVAIQFIDTQSLTIVIPAVLLVIIIYFIVSPSPSEHDGDASMGERLYRNAVVPGIGIYDGMFGPGTGSFFTMAGVSLRGLGIINATAVAKSLNFSTNVASLVVFVVAGKVLWVVGAAMMLGQLIGAWVGSHVLFKINPRYLRYLVVLICSLMLVKYADSMGWLGFVQQ
ncbi:hypothetical protein TDB9533_02915 [Thalassocella blandensis]|nr:hypothetical protein TDB9533_02915 [Thalassocella blandensis]